MDKDKISVLVEAMSSSSFNFWWTSIWKFRVFEFYFIPFKWKGHFDFPLKSLFLKKIVIIL